jgi:hypothetical protein
VAPAAPPDPDSPWLKPRLDSAKAAGAREAQTALLAELGITDVAAAKAAIAAAKVAADASKTAEQRAAELDAQLRSVVSAAGQDADLLKEQAAQSLAALTTADQEFVKSFAGDDPRTQLATIQKMRAAGRLTVAVAPPAPIAAPGATAPVGGAPPPPAGTAQPNHLATYSDLQRRNPVEAAHYLIANFDAIQKAKQPVA